MKLPLFLLSCCWATQSVTATPFFGRHRGGSRIIAKDEEETKDLEVGLPLSQSPSTKTERDAPLMRDIDMLSNILSEIVETEDKVVHDLYEEFRKYGLDRAANMDDATALKMMIQ